MQDIVITGIGVVNPLGVGRQAFWRGCRQAASGLRPIKAFDTTGLRSNVAGQVQNFKPANYLPARLYRRMSRVSKMTVAASIEAVQDSGLVFEELDRERVGIIMGTAYGGSSYVEAFYASLLEHGPRGAQPLLFPETVPNAPASHVAMYHGITGPNSTFCQNTLSGETAIQYACNLLRQKVVDVVLAGGAEELSPILFRCYDAVGTLNPVRTAVSDEAITPYPGGGLVLGEGAGVLVMERSEFAAARGADPYGVLKAVGVAGGAAAMGHYESDGSQMLRCMGQVCQQSDVSPKDIDHINPSANYSRELDRMEHQTLTAFFDARPAELRVTPLKYLMGDFGGAGVARAAAILLSFVQRTPLPTVAVDVLRRTDRSPLVWDTHSTTTPRCALMVSATFGGGCSCLVWQACSENLRTGRNQATAVTER